MMYIKYERLNSHDQSLLFKKKTTIDYFSIDTCNFKLIEMFCSASDLYIQWGFIYPGARYLDA